eukprot:1161094-Pelagomonas_calceolata.AAC.5
MVKGKGVEHDGKQSEGAEQDKGKEHSKAKEHSSIAACATSRREKRVTQHKGTAQTALSLLAKEGWARSQIEVAARQSRIGRQLFTLLCMFTLTSARGLAIFDDILASLMGGLRDSMRAVFTCTNSSLLCNKGFRPAVIVPLMCHTGG